MPLRARTGEPSFGSEPPPKVLIDYPETDQSRYFRANVDRADAYLRGAHIRLDGKPYAPIALSRMFLLRSRTDLESFTLNGRLAGDVG